MSSDEVYQKRYNIQPNPQKGARASVLARFGHQAQTLGGVSGKGAAAGPATKAKADATARMSKLAMSLAQTQADAQGRLSRIGQEMQRDELENQEQIAQAKIDQANEPDVLQDIASGLSLYHGLTGLARGIDTASGGEESSAIDEKTYNESYQFNAERLMQVEGVENPEDLSSESLKEIHRLAIAESRPKQGIAGQAVGKVADVFEGIPILGKPLNDLRKQNVASAEARKLVQQKIMTPDMAKKFTNDLSDSISRRTDMYGRPYEVPAYIQQMLLYSATDMMEMMFSGMWTDFNMLADGPLIGPPAPVDIENSGG